MLARLLWKKSTVECGIASGVTDLADVIMKGGRLTVDPGIPMDRRGAIFHDLANRFVGHLAKHSAFDCQLHEELNVFLSGDRLWQSIRQNDTANPRVSEALVHFANNLERIRAMSSFAKEWVDIYPQPHGEQSFHGKIAEHDGVKVVVSGRIDVVRRVGTNGGLEIVDYKLTS